MSQEQQLRGKTTEELRKEKEDLLKKQALLLAQKNNRNISQKPTWELKQEKNDLLDSRDTLLSQKEDTQQNEDLDNIKKQDEIIDREIGEMDSIRKNTEETEEEKAQLIKEKEYLKNSTAEIKMGELFDDKGQRKEINSIRRKIQREFTQEKKTGKPIPQQKEILHETNQKLTKQDREMTSHLNEQIKSDMLEETDDLLTRLDELEKIEEKKEEKKRGEKNKKEERELNKKVSKMIRRVGDIFKKEDEEKQNEIETKKEPTSNNEDGDLTAEEEKMLAEAEAVIKTQDVIIAKAENELKKLYAELKVAQLKEKKEAQKLSKGKAANKKIKPGEQTTTVDTNNTPISPVPLVVGEKGEPNADMEKNDKVESFSPLFIREEIISLLKRVDQINEVKNLEVLGKENKILMKAEILAQKGKTTIEINATFTNNKGEIVIENPQIDAGNLLKTAFVKGLIKPQLKDISKILKETIEKNLNKKVEKIWIEGGELKAL